MKRVDLYFVACIKQSKQLNAVWANEADSKMPSTRTATCDVKNSLVSVVTSVKTVLTASTRWTRTRFSLTHNTVLHT